MHKKVKTKLISASILGVSLTGVSSLAVACSNPVQEAKDNALNELKVDKIYDFVTPEAKEETTKLIAGAASVTKVDQYLSELKAKATSLQAKASELTAFVKENTFKVFNQQLDSSIDLNINSLAKYQAAVNGLLVWYKNIIKQDLLSNKYLSSEIKEKLQTNSDKTIDIKPLFDIYNQYKEESTNAFNKLLADKQASYIVELNKLQKRLSKQQYDDFITQIKSQNKLESEPYNAILQAAKEANFNNLRNEIIEFIKNNQAREFTAALRDSLDNKVKAIVQYSAENLATLEKLQQEAQASVANQLFEIYSNEINEHFTSYSNEMKQRLLTQLEQMKDNYNEIEEFQNVMQEARNINSLYVILNTKEKFPCLSEQDIVEFKSEILKRSLVTEEQLQQILDLIQAKDFARYQEWAKKQVSNSFEYISANNITKYIGEINQASNSAFVKEVLQTASKDNLAQAKGSLETLINGYDAKINILKTKALDMLANIAIEPTLEAFNKFSKNQIHLLSEANIFITSKLPNLVFFDQPTVLNLINAINGIDLSLDYAQTHAKFEEILTSYRTKYLQAAKEQLNNYLILNDSKVTPQAKEQLQQKINQELEIKDFIDVLTYYQTVKNDISRAIYDKYLDELTSGFDALEDNEKAQYKEHLLQLLNENKIDEFATYLLTTVQPQNQINEATTNNLKMQYKAEIEAYDYLKVVNPAKITEYVAKIEDPKLIKPSMVQQAMQAVETSYFNNYAPFAKGNVTIEMNQATFTISNGILIRVDNLQPGDYVLPQVWKVEADAFDNTYKSASSNYSFAFPNLREVNGTPFKFNGLKSINLGHIDIIPANAFKDVTSLSTIIAPEVTQVYNNAFDNTRIVTLVAPKLKTIGSKAFANNPNLSSVQFNSVTSLPNDVFANDTGLRSASFASLRTISAGESNTSLFDNNIALTNLTLPVLENIPDGLFANNKVLRTLVLPEVKTIGENAFKNSSISNLTLSKATAVGAHAFENSALAVISAPELALVGDKAFYNTQLVSLNLPKVTTAGKYAFAGNNLLKSITLQALETIPVGAFARNKVINDITLNSAKTMDNVDSNELSAFQELNTLNSLNVPSLKNISAKAFYNSQSNLTISAASLENIGERAFQEAKIKALIAPKLKTIGNYAFKNSTLTSLDFSNVETIGSGAFLNSLLTEVVANKVTSIGEYAFAGSKNLVNVEMNEVKALESGAFAKNPLLKSISFNNLLRINDWKVNEEYGKTSVGAFDTNKALTTVSLPKVQYIGVGAFDACENLTNVDIPEALDIREKAFRHNNIINLVANKVTRIDPDPFTQNDNIQTIEMKALVKLPAEAFRGMKKITSAKFEALETITSGSNEVGAFSAASDLATFEAPKLKSLGSYAFYKNKNITEYNFPVLETIGDYALANTAIKNLPSTKLITLGNYALANTSIKEINLENTETIKSGALSNTKISELNAPKLKQINTNSLTNVALRKVNVGLSSLRERETFISSKDTLEEFTANNMLSIDTNSNDGAFENFSKLDKVVTPKLERIGNFTFAGTPLKTFDFSKINHIGNSAFESTQLKGELNLPSVTTIGSRAFANSKISGKVTANMLAELGDNAFTKTNISEVEMNLLKVLQSMSFDGLPSLKKATFNKLKTINNGGTGEYNTYGAFFASGIEEFNAPELISIGTSAFASTKQLKQFNSSKVQTVGDSAFGSSGLSDFDFTNVITIGAFAFSSSLLSGELNLPNVTTIGSKAFANSKISGKVTANMLVELGDNAFTNTNISEVEMNLLNVLQSMSFDRLPSLKKATFNKLKTINNGGTGEYNTYGAFFASGIEEFNAPELISIGTSAFASTKQLKQFNSSKVQTVGDSAFGSSGLSDFDFTNVITIGAFAFSSSLLSGELNLPNVTTIGSKAFANSKISGKVTANSLTTLSDDVFSRTKISEVEMNEMESLGESSFSSLQTLKKATFNKLKTITNGQHLSFVGTYGAFYGSGIDDFTAPKLEFIGTYAFGNLHKVDKVLLKVPDNVQIAQNAFDSKEKYQIAG
ncbi:leucine-rich repeat protein [Mycoplasma sp. Z663]|uniref:leucine-rich repeat domain-containing protein n=2 Tax=unclassified Mycoplasma TaxID=2683645 RepID=UPI003AAD10EA